MWYIHFGLSLTLTTFIEIDMEGFFCKLICLIKLDHVRHMINPTRKTALNQSESGCQTAAIGVSVLFMLSSFMFNLVRETPDVAVSRRTSSKY